MKRYICGKKFFGLCEQRKIFERPNFLRTKLKKIGMQTVNPLNPYRTLFDQMAFYRKVSLRNTSHKYNLRWRVFWYSCIYHLIQTLLIYNKQSKHKLRLSFRTLMLGTLHRVKVNEAKPLLDFKKDEIRSWCIIPDNTYVLCVYR